MALALPKPRDWVHKAQVLRDAPGLGLDLPAEWAALSIVVVQRRFLAAKNASMCRYASSLTTCSIKKVQAQISVCTTREIRTDCP